MREPAIDPNNHFSFTYPCLEHHTEKLLQPQFFSLPRYINYSYQFIWPAVSIISVLSLFSGLEAVGEGQPED